MHKVVKHRVSSWARRMLACVVCSVMAVSMVWAERVSQEDAALVANHFMNVASSSSSIKKSPAKRMVLKKAAKAEENQYYVYENADGEGWVMVAANDVVRPILAYSNTGTFRTEEMPSNIQRWLVKYDRFIVQLEKDGVTAGEETSAEWKSLRKGARKAKGDAVVGPLIQTQWDQDAPYNDLCPGSGKTKAYTGCVATAMAQVMNYWKWPVKGTGSRTYQPIQQKYDSNGNITGTYIVYEGELTANFGATTYDWANMKKKHYTSDTQAQKTAISTLMYHCGVATDMMYGGDNEDGSGTYTVNYADWDWSDSEGECAQNALYMFFGYKKAIGYMRDGYSNIYKKWSDTDWENMIKTELDKKRPIMYAGAGDGGGHSFVCDGYDDAGYFHFNWGWSGSNDGYYLLSQLTPGSGGAGGGSYDFSEDQDVIIGIEPNITGHTVVVNGTGCTIAPSAQVAENSKELTATITPTDETYDFTSLTVKLGSTTLTKNTHYTLSSDNKTLTVKASAITGDAANDLTITAVWTKNRYKYELLGENSDPDKDEGMIAKNAALNLTIMPASGYTLADAACWDVTMGGNALAYGTGFTYNASNGAFAIAQVIGDVEILVYGGKQVTWVANGTTFATTLTSSDKYVLPTATPEIECDGKVFVGWCATEDYSSATTAPAFVKDGDAANKGTIFYAVFATKGEGGESEVKTYTFTSKSWAESTGTWTGTSDGNQYTTNQGVQVTTGATGAGASTSQSFSGVTKAVVNYCTNASKGAGSIDVTIGSTKVSQDVTSTGGTSLRDLEFEFEGVSGTATLVVNCTTNSIYVNSITITCGGGASYSDYTTSCTPPCVGELTGITLDTNDAQKEFTEGETFNYGGLVVTANYDGCDSKVVVPTSVSTPDMSATGKQTVTVTYEGKTATYEITITALPTYTIRFYNNGALIGTAQSVKQGQQPNVPATPSACEDYTFGGWLNDELAQDVTEKPSYATSFTATKNQDYFAAYSYTEEGEGGGETVDDELTRATTGVTGTNYSNWSGKTVNSDAVYAGNSAGGNDAIQLRSNNSNSGIVTTKSGGKITKVTVSWNSNTTSGRTLNVYGKNSAYSDATDLYGNASGELLGTIACGTSTELVIDGDYSYVGVCSNSGAMYLDAITFTWSAGGSSSTTYYTTSPNCTPCTSTVTVSKGTAENGSFSLDYIGELSTCGGAVTITVTASPAEGYRFKEITQTGMTEGVTIDQNAKTVTYAKKSEGASTISVIFEALPKYTIRFYSNGNMIKTQDVYAGNKAEKPADPSADCTDYTFVGWFTEELPEANTEKPTYVTDFTATIDQDYYAIYSKTEKSEGEEPENTTYTFTSKSWVDATKSWTSDQDGSQLVSGQGVQVTTTSTGAGATTKSSFEKVSKVVVNYCTNAQKGVGSIKVIVGDVESSKNVSKTGGTELRDLEFAFEKASGKVSFEVSCTTNSIYVNSVTITCGGGSSSTTYYTSTVTCHGSGTSVEDASQNEPVAVKAIINGQIVIIRGGAVYTLTGARVQ